jgi:hypothetical protein
MFAELLAPFSNDFDTRMNPFRLCLFWAMLHTATGLFAQSAAPKGPNEFLPHQLGEQFTPHHLLVDYFEHLAANAPATMRLERYGSSHEGRPLQVAYFSNPENLARLEQIRLNNLRLAGMAEGTPDRSNPIAIVWISMSVHGNEPSGSECSMLLAHTLATQADPQLRQWLKNTLVILDPALNPDGYDRYTHWNRMSGNRLKNIHPDAREHREPWPGGRPNHYYFDLNRDWAWATQQETQQRLQLYQRWLPHVHPDVHEQGINEPYYFAPAAEPMHDYISPWQRRFQETIGANNARYFDQNNWLYFTQEVFDLFYPSYGDTYPMFNGSIGMTYEQAGGPQGGRAVRTETSDTLTLHDRIEHHRTTCLSSIEMASKHAADLVENFQQYFQRGNTQPQGPYKAYVLRSSNDPNQVAALCRLLDRHQIRYGLVGQGMSGVRAFDYVNGRETSVSIQPKDVVISAFQPKSVLLQVLFDPESRLSDSLTYDITAWALPFAHGLEAYALRERLEPREPYQPPQATAPPPGRKPYAWCAARRSLNDAQFLCALLQQGIRVRCATKPFQLADQQFELGAIIVNRADNHRLGAKLDQIVGAAAQRHNVSVMHSYTGFSAQGSDLGSSAFALVAKPEVAILYGEGVDENAYGHAWHFFEQELEYPLTPLPWDKLERLPLHDFTTLVLAGGNYNWTDAQMEALRKWLEGGGRLIAFDAGARALADKEGFALQSKEAPKKEGNDPLPFHARERDGASDMLPGAILKTKVDNTHPLAYGLKTQYFSLKTSAEAYQMPENADCPIYVEEGYQHYGFIGARVKPRLPKSPIAALQSVGDGEVVFFVDNPLFRGFWQQGKLLFANALFLP